MNENDPIERELRNLLSVDPSPGFEDRVRAHVFWQPKAFSSNFRWAFAAAGAAAVAAIVAAVLVFQSQRVSTPGVKVATWPSLVPSPAPIVELAAPPKLTAAHRRVAKRTKAAKSEPQLIIAANEISAMRRLFSGEITELPPAFEPNVREFQTPETVIEPFPAPAAVTIDPIEPLPPAAQ